MESSAGKNTRKSSGVRRVNSVAIRTSSVNEAIGEALRHWSIKFIVSRVKTSPRTVENWREGRTGPQAKHVAAMLQDAELGPALLTAMGRSDLATAAQIHSLNRRIETLKAAEARHQREANEIRQTLEDGSGGFLVDGGSPARHSDEVEADRGVVPRSAD